MASEKILIVVLAVVLGLIQAELVEEDPLRSDDLVEEENDPSVYYRPACKYGPWSKCSKPCGGGIQKRKCTYAYPYGRRPYGNRRKPYANRRKPYGNRRKPYRPNYRVQTRRCNTHCCPVNGGFTAWTKWGSCGRNCQQVRRRFCTNPRPRCGGKRCHGPRFQKRRCKRPYCTCEWTSYTFAILVE